MIDTHAHLDFPDFDKDREDIIKKCLALDIKIINPGTNLETSNRAVELAKRYDNYYAAIGLHPEDVEQGFDLNAYKKLINEKVVAIGEIGLDYWYLSKDQVEQELTIKKQKQILEQQLDLAEECNLPVIVHCRKAFDDLISILSKRKLQGVIHCFTGNWAQAQAFIDLGYLIGLNGIMFKMDLKQVIQNCPLDKMLLETDCPFLPPLGFEKRNNPLSLPLIATAIAKIKNLSGNEIISVTDNNANQLFRLK